MISVVYLFGWALGGRPPLAHCYLAASSRSRHALEASSPMPFLFAGRPGPCLLAASLSRPILGARAGVPLVLARSLTRRLLEAALVSITSHLSFFRGEDVTLDFQLSPPADITGWTISLKIADVLGGSVQVTKSATILDAARGRFRVTLASADTASLDVGRYVWDARRTDSGFKATLADGTLDLRQEVTA